ncbi:SanA/YdcF family protein [Pelagicoccus mobilis]|uniref:YdcF family protein n=1 Tax=Pelagicoccus mobilis TaxID=415221 RepID=A0A934RV22_9BACT|nr:ElyC/SanA/YdcF family protein [Pelagicoccus mobilis]MBK1875356.1 YdcF family protein [Pelagicoccus mobilis]
MKASRKSIFGLASILSAALLAILSARAAVFSKSSEYVFESPAQVPSCHAALVLGCSQFLSDGRQNLFFKYRIEKAADLYHQGKVNYLIVSGDNSRSDYNEPGDMKAALVKAGVPENAIRCDYAGFSTLDSILRAKDVFGQKRFIVVSQDFHNHRAIFIGRSHGLEVYGLNARSVDRHNSLKTELREELARVKTVLDVWVLGRQSKFLGEPVNIDSPPTTAST